MKHYEPKSFSIPELKGISAQNIEEHTKLYQGYVKHTNLITDRIAEYSADTEKYAYELEELQRRFSFEYNGMKNHEYYFEQLESGAIALDTTSSFAQAINASFGSFDAFIARFKTIAMTRGIGWAILYRDLDSNQLVTAWVDEQHLGQLNSAQFIFGIDMWEHAYVADYQPSGKKQYIEDYLTQVNWDMVAKRFK
ncbi:MAG: Fe-Mn family superoxide dismutase [bacterium]